MRREDSLDLLGQVATYVQDLFVPDDPAMRIILDSMRDNGLSQINVTPSSGRLLYLLARLSGAQRVLEIGTLGGYSAAWLARGVAPNGRVITLEADPKHATVARAAIARTDLADCIDVRLGDAGPQLDAMIQGHESPFDLIFIDADKDAYPRYLAAAISLSHSGTLILADNVIRSGAALPSRSEGSGPSILQQFNASLTNDPRLESLIIPLVNGQGIDGIALIRVK